jgi:hypothetical protein
MSKARGDFFEVCRLQKDLDGSGSRREYVAAVRIKQLLVKNCEYIQFHGSGDTFVELLVLNSRCSKIINRGSP